MSFAHITLAYTCTCIDHGLVSAVCLPINIKLNHCDDAVQQALYNITRYKIDTQFVYLYLVIFYLNKLDDKMYICISKIDSVFFVLCSKPFPLCISFVIVSWSSRSYDKRVIVFIRQCHDSRDNNFRIGNKSHRVCLDSVFSMEMRFW